MKKICKILIILSLFLFTACSSGEKDFINDKENKGNSLIINEIKDEELYKKIQELIDVFYYNPMVSDDTGHDFFIDDQAMLSFSAYYKNTFSSEKSPKEIAYWLFGLKTDLDLTDNLEMFTDYWTVEDKNYLPILEAIYQNENYLIAKAGVYSIIEGTSSERQSAATITMTFEKEEKQEEYKIIDYKYDKISDTDE